MADQTTSGDSAGCATARNSHLTEVLILTHAGDVLDMLTSGMVLSDDDAPLVLMATGRALEVCSLMEVGTQDMSLAFGLLDEVRVLLGTLKRLNVGRDDVLSWLRKVDASAKAAADLACAAEEALHG